MKKQLLLTALFVLSIGLTKAQVGINTSTPQGALEITSDTMGLVVPRVTSVDNVNNGIGGDAVDGTILYNQSLNAFMFRVENKWLKLGVTAAGLADFTRYFQNYTYAKASNTDANDYFGYSVSISSDGNTLAVGTYGEGSNATGIDGDQSDNSAYQSGAVYIFTRSGSVWSQQAYIKASNTDAYDWFGFSVSISSDGNTLAVGAIKEGSNATGINGDQSDNSAGGSGAVYIFTRSGSVWSQQAYIKASNTDANDQFGWSVSISSDGNTLAVGTYTEDSNAAGINGDQSNNSASQSGAVYIFTRSGSVWSQQAYIKASNTDANDYFGKSVLINNDGNTLAVGASGEGSNATGINGDQSNNSAGGSGAVYIFTRSGSVWTQQDYIKASNTEANDYFGRSVSINNDGNTLVIGASGEGSNATGINGDQSDNSAGGSGAVYIFTRSGSVWSQQAYVKASNTDAWDSFGRSVSISSDGNTLAVGTGNEDSNAAGINGDQSNNSASQSGAVYIFIRSGSVWTQQDYIKASNTGGSDHFGNSVSISNDGNTIVVGATSEDSYATGINGVQSDNSAQNSGAAYIIKLDY